MTASMDVYCAMNNDTRVRVLVELVSPEIGVGQIDCLECCGTGRWDFGPDEVHGPCIACKGTGKVYTSL